MYRGSEVGISLSVLSTDVSSDYLNRKGNASKAKFAPSNIGASFEMYRGPGSLTSFSLGVGYNRKIDFSTSSRAFGRVRALDDRILLGKTERTFGIDAARTGVSALPSVRQLRNRSMGSHFRVPDRDHESRRDRKYILLPLGRPVANGNDQSGSEKTAGGKCR